MGRKGWTSAAISRDDYDDTQSNTRVPVSNGERSSLLSSGTSGYAPLSGG